MCSRSSLAVRAGALGARQHELLAGRDADERERGRSATSATWRRAGRSASIRPTIPTGVARRRRAAVVAPLFLLYDYYGFAQHLAPTVAERLEIARAARVVAIDEYMLDPAPHPSREAWCAARIAATEARLDAIDPSLPTVLVSHWPLHEHPTEILRHPEFALWCGTPRTADWHERYRALACVYGHLHIPRRTTLGTTRFEEVSLGYPREWRRSVGRAAHGSSCPRRRPARSRPTSHRNLTDDWEARPR